jgi:hypothetical protein
LVESSSVPGVEDESEDTRGDEVEGEGVLSPEGDARELEAEAMTDDGYCEDEADRITDDVLVAPFVEVSILDVSADSVARIVEEENVGSMPVTLLEPLEVTDGKGKLVLLVPVGATVVEFSNGAEQPYP